jgi:predicted O-methyltransferase YrrM
MGLSPELREYMLSVSSREPEILAELREETGKMSNANMQISPEQGQLLNFLVKAAGCRKAVEVGTFTGYSSIWTALALPEDGELVACDVSREYTDVACRYWNRIGLQNRIRLMLGPAVDSLHHLLEAEGEASFDFAFIDADKQSYGMYYDLCLRLLRSGGLMALDNVFRHGRVLETEPHDPGTNAMRKLNRRIHSDESVDVTMIPIGDGLTIVRKR